MIVDIIVKISIGLILILYAIIAFVVTIFSFFICDNPNSSNLVTILFFLSLFLCFPVSIIALNLFSSEPNNFIISIIPIYINIFLIYIAKFLLDKFNKGNFALPIL